MTRPGDRLHAFAMRWCSPDAMSHLIDPVIADLQAEHGQALHEGRRWRGRRVRLSGYVAFLKVFVVCDWSPRNDTRPLLRAAGFALAATAVVTAVFDVIPLTRFWSAPGDRQTLAVSLIPQALTISLPIGLTVGVVLGFARRRVSARLAAVVAAAAAVISIGSIANVGWILPNANQAFRVAIFERLARQGGRPVLRREPDKGEPELTFGELTEQMDRYAGSPRGSSEWWRASSLRFHYHTRWSLAFAPFALTLFSTSLAAGTRKRWVLWLGALAVIIGYDIVLYVSRGLVLQGELSPPIAAWFANVITLIASALLVIRHRSRSRAERIGEGQAFRA